MIVFFVFFHSSGINETMSVQKSILFSPAIRYT